MLLLSNIQLGQKVVIKEISDELLAERLFEMGCFSGEEITVINIAPAKDPIMIEVSGYYLALRLSEAKYIEVENIAS
jgi:Fe2+ transport system protein FeoA